MSTPVLDTAIAWWRAAGYSGSGDLQDGSGNAHHAQLGSTSGADINDPTYIEPDSWVSYAAPGTQFLYFPGTAGNYASAPHIAAYNINGDLEIEVIMDLLAEAPSANVYLAAHGTWVNGSWMFYKQNDGKLWLRWYDSGDTGYDIKSTVAAAYADGYKVTFDVDNDAGGHTVTFYKTDDMGDSWDLVEEIITGGGTTDIRDASQALTAGGGGSIAEGNLYRAIVRDGIAGTVVFDADFTDRNNVVEPYATFTEDSVNAATVTINRSATGRKSAIVDRPMFLLGTDDYLEVADHADLNFAAADSFTVMALWRRYGTPTSNCKWIDKRSGYDAGYYIMNNGTALNIKGYIEDVGASFVFSPGSPNTVAGTLAAAAFTREVSADEIDVFVNGLPSAGPQTDTTTDTLVNAANLIIGASSIPDAYLDGEFIGAAIFRSALSAAQIITAGNELQGIIALAGGSSVGLPGVPSLIHFL